MKPTPIPAERIRAITADPTIPIAHRALWQLLYDTDLRLDDVLSLDVRDIDLDHRTIHGESIKDGNPSVTVPIGDRTAQLLREVIGDRDAGPLILDKPEHAMRRDTAIRAARNLADTSIHAFRTAGQVTRRPA